LFSSGIPLPILCLMTAVTLHCILKVQICSAACERLAEDKHEGTLELVLSTPLSVREIVSGQWLALRRFFTVPLLLVVSQNVLMLGLVAGTDIFPEPKAPIQLLVAGVALLLVDGVALGWVGMWQAISARNSQHARSCTLFYILVLPWIVFLLIMSIEAFAGRARSPTWNEGLGLWFGMGLINSVGFALSARAKLYLEFRTRATQRFQPGKTEFLAEAAETV
jgi:ABC-type Na+ efflux pump permease subunit